MESTTSVTSPAGTLTPDAIVASSNTPDLYSPAAVRKAYTDGLVTLAAELDRAIADKAKAAKRVTSLRAELVETQRVLRAMTPRTRKRKEPAK